MFAVWAVRLAGSRLRFLVVSAALQATVLFPIALLSLTVSFSQKIFVLIALMVIFRVLGNLIGTAWGSLMSDYLLPNQRGRYLGWRSQVVGIAGVLGMGFAGILLFVTKEISPALGFFVLFILASVCRLVSSVLLGKMVDLPLHHSRHGKFSFLMFLGRFKEDNLARFLLYAASILFAANLAGTYFSVYVLKELHFSYVEYTAVHLSAVIAGLISFPIWGRHADIVEMPRS